MTNAKRGRGRLRTNSVRVAGWDRVVRLLAVAALGIALSACGGGGSSSSAASAAQGSEPTQSSISDQGSTAQSSTTTDSSPGQSTGSSGTQTGSTGSGATTGSPPTATIGAVTLNWTPPTENVDGSALTNLAGYRIHYGTAPGNYTQTVTVDNPGLATYVISSLTAGTYYFSVAAYNADGTESPLSSEVSAKVD